MKRTPRAFFCGLLILSQTAEGAVRYVNLNNPTPSAPYASWATAATNIQQAVDVASASDLILVTNGVYESGVITNLGRNRVHINKPVTVQSVNGPGSTIIRGYQTPGTTNGTDAIRGVFLGTGAILSGFTVEKGAGTGSPAGGSEGGGIRCVDTTSIITNCIIAGNAATVGGGVSGGTLINCLVVSNTAVSFSNGGGAYKSAAINTIFIGNECGYRGAAAANSFLTNCVLTGNHSGYYAGGADGSTLVNCTVVGNTAFNSGGGTDGGRMLNSIVYFNKVTGISNSPSMNFSGGFFTNSCTFPLPFLGTNNMTNAPMFMDHENGNFHLQPISPCRNAGNNTYMTLNTDFAGQPRLFGGTIDLGAFENQFAGTIRYVALSNAVPSSPFTSWATAATNIQDAVDVALPGDFVYVSNGVYRAGSRTVDPSVTNRVVVDKAITLRSVSGPASTLIVGEKDGTLPPRGIRCVYLAAGAELHGFTLTNGATAGSGDDAIARSGGGVWCEDETALVANCVLIGNSATRYGGGAFGGTLVNCLLTTNIASFGAGASSNLLIECNLIGNDAVYHNLNSGGGAYGSTLSNCVVAANRALGGGGRGGGLYDCLAINTVISNNSAQTGGGLIFGAAEFSRITGNGANRGGGTVSNVLNNCLIASNNATMSGGGAYYSTLNDCLLLTNTATSGAGAYFGTLDRCELRENRAIAISGSAAGGGSEGSVLNDCVLIRNFAALGGGGIRARFNRCLLLDNRASLQGGGSNSGSLSNCVLIGNSAQIGGGHYGGSGPLVNCTIVSNTATSSGGGVHGGNATHALNSIIYYNEAPEGSNNAGMKMEYCNTIPIFGSSHNFTNEPGFVDLAGRDLRLAFNSPNINSGRNIYAPAGPDITGNPRIVGGTVDVGAYEYQTPASILSYAWAQDHGIPTDGSADHTDADGDGFSNAQEWRMRTGPNDASSFLKMLGVGSGPSVGSVFVSWQTVPGVYYFLQRKADLGSPTPFTTIRSNLIQNSGNSITITDTNATGGGPFFYRVGVQE